MPNPHTSYTDLYSNLQSENITTIFRGCFGGSYIGGMYFGRSQFSASFIVQLILAYTDLYN